jgi:hypothetical protein
MSNNIYDILKKMENLEAPKQSLTEGKKAKPDFLDMDKDGDKKEPLKKAAKEKSKGAIGEAVARVEKQLAEKYNNHKKQLSEREMEESGLQAYLGKKKYGEQGMKALQQAGRDGASKEKMAMIRAKHDKMDEAVGQEGPADLLAAIEQEINNPGRSIDNLIDVLNATFGSDRSPEFKKARAVIGKYIDLVDNAAMGSEEDGIAPMRGGNIARHIQQYDLTDYLQHAAAMLDKAVKGPMDEGSYNEDMLSPAQKKFAALAEPKDKITYADKIAGAKKKTEGNKFSGNLMKARAQGLKQADLDGDGEMEKVHEGWDDMMKAAKERSGPQPRGGSGIKQGTRYGGGRQTDDPDTDNETGEVAKKGRGRPKKINLQNENS